MMLLKSVFDFSVYVILLWKHCKILPLYKIETDIYICKQLEVEFTFQWMGE